MRKQNPQVTERLWAKLWRQKLWRPLLLWLRRLGRGDDRASLQAFQQSLLHQSADLELDGPLGRHLDPLHRLWVLGDAGCSRLCLEHAKVPELQTVTFAKLVNDLVEEMLNDVLHNDPLGLGLVRNSVNQLFFRYRVHGQPLSGGLSKAVNLPPMSGNKDRPGIQMYVTQYRQTTSNKQAYVSSSDDQLSPIQARFKTKHGAPERQGQQTYFTLTVGLIALTFFSHAVTACNESTWLLSTLLIIGLHLTEEKKSANLRPIGMSIEALPEEQARPALRPPE